MSIKQNPKLFFDFNIDSQEYEFLVKNEIKQTVISVKPQDLTSLASLTRFVDWINKSFDELR